MKEENLFYTFMSLSAHMTRKQLPLLLDAFDNVVKRHA